MPDAALEKTVAAFTAAVEQGDMRAVARLCDGDPSVLVFARNGHAYRGAANVARTPGDGTPAGVTVTGPPLVWRAGDVAWVAIEAGRGTTSGTLTTLVLTAAGDGWRIAHAHLSPCSPHARPDGSGATE